MKKMPELFKKTAVIAKELNARFINCNRVFAIPNQQFLDQCEKVEILQAIYHLHSEEKDTHASLSLFSYLLSISHPLAKFMSADEGLPYETIKNLLKCYHLQNSHWQLQLADFFYAIHAYHEAVEAYEYALKLEAPLSFSAFKKLGLACVTVKEFSKAQTYFQKALDLPITDWHTYHDIERWIKEAADQEALKNEGSHSSTTSSEEISQDKSSAGNYILDDLEAMDNLDVADSYVQAKGYEEAILLYKYCAFDTNEEYTLKEQIRAHISLGDVYSRLENIEGARLSYGYTILKFSQACRHIRSDNHYRYIVDDAELELLNQDYRCFLESKTPDEIYYSILSLLYNEMISLFQLSINENITLGSYLLGQASESFKNGIIEEIKEHLERYYLVQGVSETDLEKAEHYFMLANELDRKDSARHLKCGDYYSELYQKNSDGYCLYQAKQYYLQAFKANPDCGVTNNRLANLYSTQNEVGLAILHYCYSLGINPTDEVVQYRLKKLLKQLSRSEIESAITALPNQIDRNFLINLGKVSGTLLHARLKEGGFFEKLGHKITTFFEDDDGAAPLNPLDQNLEEGSDQRFSQ